MSPILVRPVREQLEHDRVIRFLQAKWRRRYTVAINVGAEQESPIRVGESEVYPDVVLTPAGGGKKLLGVVEVETGESVNHLEAMSQWVPLGKSRAPFQLYVPVGESEAARRLCAEHKIKLAELWTFHGLGDQLHFTLVQRMKRGARATALKSKTAAKNTASQRKPKPGGGRKATKVPKAAASRKAAAKRTAKAASRKVAAKRTAKAGSRKAAAKRTAKAAPRKVAAKRTAKAAPRKAAAKATAKAGSAKKRTTGARSRAGRSVKRAARRP